MTIPLAPDELGPDHVICSCAKARQQLPSRLAGQSHPEGSWRKRHRVDNGHRTREINVFTPSSAFYAQSHSPMMVSEVSLTLHTKWCRHRSCPPAATAGPIISVATTRSDLSLSTRCCVVPLPRTFDSRPVIRSYKDVRSDAPLHKLIRVTHHPLPYHSWFSRPVCSCPPLSARSPLEAVRGCYALPSKCRFNPILAPSTPRRQPMLE